ncbi:hypothetical protein [Candidatus Soleaferrea massiliensis]|uniref:hypothetical protein n=1 Tax=Candidatus Soleaferrea massiliensis TaxID=1470354 RepID=UPI000693AC9E|nr:hypothetical protein [Candidatus Soleaferrea massiliensis]
MPLPAGSTEIIRKAVTKDTVLDVVGYVGFIRIIQAPNDKIRGEVLRRRHLRGYYDEIEWFRVIKSVYLRAEEKPLPQDEYVYAQRAKEYLHGEISALPDIEVDAMEDLYHRCSCR